MVNRSKLSVIVHADVVGSTSLVQADERLAHERMQRAFRRLAQSVEDHGGTTLEIRGDALVAEFGRASDAVMASLTFQQENQKLRAADAPTPEIRIGAALGEVVIADDTVTGTGVVLAQRLEQLARAGGLCVSAAVHEAVPGRLPVTFENLGDRALKGFTEPVRVYAVTLQAGVTLSVDTPPFVKEQHALHDPPLPLPSLPSIAVLPFVTRVSSEELDMFAEGLAEDVTTGLSRIRELFVIDRNSTSGYTDDVVDTKAVGRDLGVRYVLEGSVRGAAGRTRVTVRLIEAATRQPVWGEKYDRIIDDLFEVQDELTRNIVASLQTQLVLSEGERATADVGGTPIASVSLRRAARLLYELSDDGLTEALAIARSALERDPNDPAALRVLASCLYHRGVMGQGPTCEPLLEDALEAARRSAALDEQNELTHWLIGNLELWLRRRHEQAIAAFERCLDINPNYSLGFASLGNTLIYAGEPDRGTEQIHTALRCNPRDPYNFFRHQALALGYFLMERHDEALAWSNRALHRRPDLYRSRIVHAAILSALGRVDEARIAWIKQEPSAAKDDLGWLPFRRSVDRDRLEAALAPLRSTT